MIKKRKIFYEQNKEKIKQQKKIRDQNKKKLSKPKIKNFDDNVQDVVQDNNKEVEQDEIQAEMPVPYE